MQNLNNSIAKDVVIYAHYCTYTNNRGELKPQPSVETQLESCRKYAKRNKLNVVGEYFGESTSRGRNTSHYKKMMEERETTQFHSIVVYSLGSLYIEKTKYTRGVDYTLHAEVLKKHDISLLPVKTGYRTS
jgi:DNA invertase Pin-like site-specific DNA recombinase